MSIEQDFYTAISGVAGGRIYPNVARQDTDYPCVVYQRTSTARWNSVDGDQMRVRARVQCSCWSQSYAGAKTLAGEVKAAVRASTLVATTDSELDDYEDGERLFRVIVDFQIMGND